MSDKITFILDNLPSETYDKQPTSNLYNILNAMAEELNIFVGQVDDVRKSRFIEENSGVDLDKIGMLLSVYRLYQESDIEFRNRIQARVQSFIGGGTINSIRNIILEYLKVDPLIIEHYLPENGFTEFHSGVLYGMIAYKDNDFMITEGTAYIDGIKVSKEHTLLLPANTPGDYFIFLNSAGNYIVRNVNSIGEDEILLYYIIINSDLTYTIADLKLILKPDTHRITNTATITVSLPLDVDESILTTEEIKNIITRNKAAGIAVLLTFFETKEEEIKLLEAINPFFIMGSAKKTIGSNNLIGYDRTFEELIEENETLLPFRFYTWRQIGVSTAGYQEYGGF